MVHTLVNVDHTTELMQKRSRIKYSPPEAKIKYCQLNEKTTELKKSNKHAISGIYKSADSTQRRNDVYTKLFNAAKDLEEWLIQMTYLMSSFLCNNTNSTQL